MVHVLSDWDQMQDGEGFRVHGAILTQLSARGSPVGAPFPAERAWQLASDGHGRHLSSERATSETLSESPGGVVTTGRSSSSLGLS